MLPNLYHNQASEAEMEKEKCAYCYQQSMLIYAALYEWNKLSEHIRGSNL